MELEQARKRAEELRVIIEKKATAYTTTRTPPSWRISSTTL